MTDLLTGIPFRDGPTYVHERDGVRLAAQHQRVKDFLMDGKAHTLAEITKATGDPEASVSARIRDLRKARFGSHIIVREYVKDGLHTYRLEIA